jgi:hypothetical protein
MQGCSQHQIVRSWESRSDESPGTRVWQVKLTDSDTDIQRRLPLGSVEPSISKSLIDFPLHPAIDVPLPPSLRRSPEAVQSLREQW